MMRIAITGASGLLGGHLIDTFLQKGYSVIAVVRNPKPTLTKPGVEVRVADVQDPLSLIEAFDGAEAVVHAAGFVSFNPRHRNKIFEVNVAGTAHAVNACLQLGIKKLIHISSVAALGRKPGTVLNEDSKWIDVPASPYVVSKHRAELEVYRGAEEGLQVSVVNPSVIISGTTDRSSGALLNYVWHERPFYTDGILNYVDARDVAEVVSLLTAAHRAGQRFILNGGAVGYREFFTQVAQRMNKKVPGWRLPASLAWWAGAAEEFRSIILNREPMVTRQSAAMTNQAFQYDTRPVVEDLGFTFRPLTDTLDWACEAYRRNVTGNK
jgi:nucleoside-diphosphate-sugar epimerase